MSRCVIIFLAGGERYGNRIRPLSNPPYSCPGFYRKWRSCSSQNSRPLTLGRATEPFSHPDWLFEIKWDGFRSLVRIEQGKCRLVSRKGNDFKSFRKLNESQLQELTFRSAVPDGEIVSLNGEGKPEFRDLLLRRGKLCFIPFDLLWFNEQDLTYAPLIERKHQLRAILPKDSDNLRYCDHVERDARAYFDCLRERFGRHRCQAKV